MAERKELREADIAKVEELGYDESTIDQVAKETGKSKTEVRSLIVKGNKDILEKASTVQVKAEGLPRTPTGKTALERLAATTPQTGAINVVSQPEPVRPQLTADLTTGKISAPSDLAAKSTALPEPAPAPVPKPLAGLQEAAAPSLRTAETAAAKAATPEVKEVAETVVKAASKGLSGKAKLLGAGLAAGAGTAAYLASRGEEKQPARTTGFRPTPEGTTSMAPTPTGQMEDVSALPSRIKDLQLKASTEEKNKAIVQTSDSLSSSIAASDSKEANVFQKRLDELSKEKDEAYQEYKEGKNRIANAELLDALGKGLAQLAAGWYGLNTGVDAVSGVDFKPKDWSNTYLLAEREYRTKREGIQEEIKDVRGEQRELAREARAEKAYERRVEAATKREETARTRAEEKQEQARQKEAKRKEEERTEDQQKAITKLRQAIEGLKSSSNKKNIQATKEAMVAAGMSSEQIEQAFDVAEKGINDYSRLEQFIPQVQQPSAPEKPAAAAPAGGPAPGTIIERNGKWRFKGGDPTQPASWERVQ